MFSQTCICKGNTIVLESYNTKLRLRVFIFLKLSTGPNSLIFLKATDTTMIKMEKILHDWRLQGGKKPTNNQKNKNQKGIKPIKKGS